MNCQNINCPCQCNDLDLYIQAVVSLRTNWIDHELFEKEIVQHLKETEGSNDYRVKSYVFPFEGKELELEVIYNLGKEQRIGIVFFSERFDFDPEISLPLEIDKIKSVMDRFYSKADAIKQALKNMLPVQYHEFVDGMEINFDIQRWQSETPFIPDSIIAYEVL